jgi:hypothetical protein
LQAAVVAKKFGRGLLGFGGSDAPLTLVAASRALARKAWIPSATLFGDRILVVYGAIGTPGQWIPCI